MKAFRVMGRSVKASYDELFLLVFLSVLWWIPPLVIGLPALYLAQRLQGTVLVLLGIITLALIVVASTPATVGINRIANRMANYQRVDSSFFWSSVKENFGRGWVLFVLTFLAPLGLLFNIWFYSQGQGLVVAVSALWFWVLMLLLMMGQYFFPLLWQQEDPRLMMLLRNALLLALRHPLYSFFMLIYQVLVLAICVGLAVPLFLLGPGMLAVAGNFGLTGLLQEMDMAPQPPESFAPPKRGR